ncbi:MAG: site-2 protease family protein [Candidatus Acidiferrales bacterium]
MLRSRGVRIGKLFGIPIFLHTSWFVIFALITFSLEGEYALAHPQWTQQQHWGLALVTSLLFFGSVLFHEMSHSMVARHYRIPVVSITLFFFGGVAMLNRDPESALQEFNIASAGPASSYLLAGIFYLVSLRTPQDSMAGALTQWLSYINFWLATFNLLPGFPMDGGRILRSIVWGVTKSYSKASRLAARTGQVIAYGMMGVGAWEAVRAYQTPGGDIVNGIWLAAIGWFLLSAAKQSYAQAETRTALEGLLVSDIMTAEPPIVGREISLEDYAREVNRSKRTSHLVVAHGQLVGMISSDALARVPQEDWGVTSVQAVMTPRDKLLWAEPSESALKLLDRMRSVGVQQMPVIADGSVVGMVTRESIVHALEHHNQMAHPTGA